MRAGKGRLAGRVAWELAGRAARDTVPGHAGCRRWPQPCPWPRSLSAGVWRAAFEETPPHLRSPARPAGTAAASETTASPGPRTRAAHRGAIRERGGRWTNAWRETGAVCHREPQHPWTSSAPCRESALVSLCEGGGAGTGRS